MDYSVGGDPDFDWFYWGIAWIVVIIYLIKG